MIQTGARSQKPEPSFAGLNESLNCLLKPGDYRSDVIGPALSFLQTHQLLDDPRVHRAMIVMLADDQAHGRLLRVLSFVGKYPPKADEIGPVLIHLLRHEDVAVAKRAARALAKLYDYEAASFAPVLLVDTDRPEGRVSAQYYRCLDAPSLRVMQRLEDTLQGVIREGDAKICEVLKMVQSDEWHSSTQCILVALYALKKPHTFIAEALSALRTFNPTIPVSDTRDESAGVARKILAAALAYSATDFLVDLHGREARNDFLAVCASLGHAPGLAHVMMKLDRATSEKLTDDLTIAICRTATQLLSAEQRLMPIRRMLGMLTVDNQCALQAAQAIVELMPLLSLRHAEFALKGVLSLLQSKLNDMESRAEAQNLAAALGRIERFDELLYKACLEMAKKCRAQGSEEIPHALLSEWWRCSPSQELRGQIQILLNYLTSILKNGSDSGAS